MKILAIECSAGPASAAVVENGRVLASASVNVKLTHSQTLMPMVKGVLESSLTEFSQIEGIAVAAGPGSFTGIRIGIAAVKGLAAPKGLPCAPVSTLRAMAEPFKWQDVTVCAVMDARCNQVYNALFEIKDRHVTRLCADRALMCDELASEIAELSREGKKIIVTGDGTELFMPYVSELCGVTAPSEPCRYQSAAAVGLCAEELFSAGQAVAPQALMPVYLRLPQAERELKAKMQK